MTRVNAMEVWDKVCESNWCTNAHNFYEDQNISKNIILQRGGADFDESLGKRGEKPWFRAAYYAGSEGYMRMHIRQNRTIFMKQRVTRILKNRRTLFVDFGCGPMTSGVVLAEMLSIPMADYKDKVLYVGIDVSENMCKIANWTNEIEKDCRIFDRFSILKEDTLAPQEIFRIVSENFQPEVAVMCLSYVLAKDTYSKDQLAAVDLAKKWQQIIQQYPDCQESLVIYMNPKFHDAHRNWYYMVEEFKKPPLRNWHFEISPLKSISVDGLSGRVDTQTIIGKRRK